MRQWNRWRTVAIMGVLAVLGCVVMASVVFGATSHAPTIQPISPNDVGATSIAKAAAATATAKAAPPTAVAQTEAVDQGAVGNVISTPAIQSGPSVTFRALTTAPGISQHDAQQAIDNRGVPGAFGGAVNGKQVTATAIHGVATFGHPGTRSAANGSPLSGGCVNWFGPCNLPVEQCVKGVGCSRTSAVIPRLENRPMWIIDLGNIEFRGSHSTFNHAVYAVDDATRSVVYAWFYNGA